MIATLLGLVVAYFVALTIVGLLTLGPPMPSTSRPRLTLRQHLAWAAFAIGLNVAILGGLALLA